MRIDIIGGGAIGMLIGARLAAIGANLTIWTRTERQAEMLREQGIRLLTSSILGSLESPERIIDVRSNWIGNARAVQQSEATQSASKAEEFRWIILTVKQTDINHGLIEQLQSMTLGSSTGAGIICLQNGVGHLEFLTEFIEQVPIYPAVTTMGAKRIDDRTVQFTGEGQLWLGDLDENKRNTLKYYEIPQKMLIEQLQLAGFAASLSNDMNNRIYNKLLMNAVINPLTAIFDVTNGELPSHRMRESLMRELFIETESILIEAGMEPMEDGWAALLLVCERTSNNVSSMLSDVRANRDTEIQAINGAVLKLADQLGKDAPLNRAVTAIITAYQIRRNMKE